MNYINEFELGYALVPRLKQRGLNTDKLLLIWLNNIFNKLCGPNSVFEKPANLLALLL